MLDKVARSLHMLMGKYQNSIDGKARMIIPAKLRDEFHGVCVLTTGMDKCLYVYPMKDWEEFVSRMKDIPRTDEAARAFIRNFFANAITCEIDRQGRVTIPQDHREYANIQKDLITVGNFEKLEVWAKEEWDRNADKTELSPSEIAQKMVEYGI